MSSLNAAERKPRLGPQATVTEEIAGMEGGVLGGVCGEGGVQGQDGQEERAFLLRAAE